jgi:hypothetical protein
VDVAAGATRAVAARRFRLACAALACALGLAARGAEAARPVGELDLADWILGNEVAFTGTLVRQFKDERPVAWFAGGDASRTLRTGFSEYEVKVDEVLLGTLTDSIQTVSSFQSPWDGDGGRLLPGARVLAWGYRRSGDGWRLWGDGVPVAGDGTLRPTMEQLVNGPVWLRGRTPGPAMRLANLKRALAGGASRHTCNGFNGARAVVLVRVLTVDLNTYSGTFTCEVDSLRTVTGLSGRAPRRLTFDPSPWNSLGAVGAGDTLVIPVREFGPEARYAIPFSGWKVANGFVPSLGVPVDSLSRALSFGDQGVRVAPFALP